MKDKSLRSERRDNDRHGYRSMRNVDIPTRSEVEERFMRSPCSSESVEMPLEVPTEKPEIWLTSCDG